MSVETLSLEEQFKSRLDAFGDDPRRARAFEAFAATGLPHRRIEGWKWSDVRAALRKAPDVSSSLPEDVFADVAAPSVIFGADGVTGPEIEIPGLRIETDQPANAFGGSENLPMGALAAALAPSGATVTIEVSEAVSTPLKLVFQSLRDMQFTRVNLLVRTGASLTLVESHLSAGGFSNVVLDYELEPGASLERVVSQAASPSAVQLATNKVSLGEDARYVQTAFGEGAALCRFETRLSYRGMNAHAQLNGAYLLNDGRHLDFTSFVNHGAAHCTTEQKVKGAVKKGGISAFQGKFFVARDAQKTDAQMAHNALMLEDGAEVNSKPELEIYADDVQCAHGNTVGALDEAAIFYMRQRGVSLAQARAMLTMSFIAEAFDAVSSDEVRDILERGSEKWLMSAL